MRLANTDQQQILVNWALSHGYQLDRPIATMLRIRLPDGVTLLRDNETAWPTLRYLKRHGIAKFYRAMKSCDREIIRIDLEIKRLTGRIQTMENRLLRLQQQQNSARFPRRRKA